MALPVLTDEQILIDLASILKLPRANLPTHYADIVTRAHGAAVGEIYGRLLKRGFTASQVDSWDRASEFESDISCYWCIVRGGYYGNLDEKVVEALDRRKELDEVSVIVNGVWKTPETTPGLPASGPPNDAGQFNWPDEPPSYDDLRRW